MTKKETKSLRTLTKGNVWELQESDVFVLWAKSDKEDAIAEHAQHYLDIIRSAFDVEEVKSSKPEILAKYEERGMRVGVMQVKEKDQKWAIKKRPINRVTDLTYENIRHISAAKLLEVIDRNFGGGWDSLNQAIKDVILSGFDISTTTLPRERLRKPGGLYDIKTGDGFDVLEIEKGGWVEAIFAKVKPVAIKPTMKLSEEFGGGDFDDNPDADIEMKDNDYMNNEDDDELDDETLTEESYRTIIEENPDDLSLDASEEISDSDDDY